MSELKIVLDCPLCDTHELQVMAHKNKKLQQCIACGYSTSDDLKIKGIGKEKNKTYQDLDKHMKRWSKESSGYMWIPSILNLPIGIIYPYEDNENKMVWAFAPLVEIPEADRKNYPREDGSGFYETRYDISKQIFFESFDKALIETNLVMETIKKAEQKKDNNKSKKIKLPGLDTDLSNDEIQTLHNTFHSEMMQRSDNRIPDMYETHCDVTSDINEHLPIIKKYAEKCDHITEMGVRYIVSTWAFLMSHPNKIISIDYEHPSVHDKDIAVYDEPLEIHRYGVSASEKLKIIEEDSKKVGIDFEFQQADTLKIEIKPTDLLFIDTEHNYDQLKAELAIHSKNAKKYMMFHDTVTYGRKSMDDKDKGLMDAIEEFLENNDEWKIENHYEYNNGLLVLERVSAS
tara:strand:- start:9733 stop:10938 length:1206 start_codon:yes stop_codon:yes gene_type:complete